MKITESFDLKQLSYLRIGGVAKYYIEIEKEDELHKIIDIQEKERLPVIVVGAGSNTVFADGVHNKVFVRMKNDSILKVYEDESAVNIDVGAGTEWDTLVAWAVKKKFSGLELLSAIPGSVGAAPIQNIGAYGGEIANTITHVRVFDLQTNEFYEITNRECAFAYRDSYFKKNPGRFIITTVSFRLSKEKPPLPQYKDLALYFLGKRNKHPSIKEIRDAVIAVRSKKLPDPTKMPNCGSFFKNPIIAAEKAFTLVSHFTDMPHWPLSKEETKLSGGWLIEKSGFKGKDFGTIRVSDTNALILINHNNATMKELEAVVKEITLGVKKNFDVTIETEPNFVY